MLVDDYNITPARFLEIFGPALQEFLENTYGKEGAHALDLIPQASVFFDVSYHAISAMDYARRTDSKSKTTKTKNQ